jgi:hypothetical protein
MPDKKLVQRWNLATFELEVTAPLPVQAKIYSAVMGSASDGPLVVGGPEMRNGLGLPLRFIDVRSLQETDLNVVDERQAIGMVGTHPQHPHVMRISPDGRVIGMWNIGLRPSGLQSVVREGDTLRVYYEHESVGHVVPGPDGRTLYTGAGLYTAEGKKIGKEGASAAFPALHGDLYLSWVGWVVHRTGDTRPLLALQGLEGMPVPDPFRRDTLPMDKRVFFIPQGKLIVTIPETGDKLHLQRFDLDEALETSGIDYLLVTSQPPHRFKPGKRLNYQMAVKSKKGGVKYKLESGPQGMAVSPSGQVTWSVPADYAGREENVIITVSDAAGQEIFHTFRIVQPNKDGEAKKPADLPPVAEVRPPRDDRPILPILPPPLKADTEGRPLPSPVGGLCFGGGGRFLIMHLQKERKLAIFDVNEAKVVKYLPVPEGQVFFAAGLEKLIVALPTSQALQRWSLRTLEWEATVPCPVKGTVQGLAMGSASRGPLAISTPPAILRLLDPQTLKESDCKLEAGAGSGPLLRVSADGRVIVGGAGAGWVLEGKTYKRYPLPGDALPGPDGRTLYTAGRLYTAEGKPLGEQVGGPGRMVWYVPAVQGPFYFSLSQVPKEGRPGHDTLRFSVHLPGEKRPVASLPFLASLDTLMNWGYGVPPFEQHVFLIPDAKLLVVLPDRNDRLVLHRFDLDELLAKADVDYLFVQSQPVTIAARGQPYAYQLAVKSKKGGLKYKLESGPEGMKVSAEGKLTWSVPKDFAEGDVDVLLTIADQTGQEIFHAFRLAVKKVGEVVAAPPKVQEKELPRPAEPPADKELPREPPKPNPP